MKIPSVWKMLMLAAAGSIGLAGASILIPVRAQDAGETVTIVEDKSDLELDLEAEAIVPDDRGELEQPNEGGRQILGTDDRIPLTSQKYPWSAIGRIVSIGADRRSQWSCTGALVASDVVLTNAHCVLNPETSQFHAKGMLLHDCDTTGGASGGPILTVVDGKIAIVALHSGAVQGANVAVEISRIGQ